MDFEKLRTTFSKITKEVNKIVVGQNEVIEQIMISILADSNALLESAPGLGKTLTIKAISEVMDLKFSRIQFTPDLMPSDVTGTQIIEEVNGKRFFKFEQGPIFANIVLADEINRATPKTQSALLEAMQEKQVTIGNKTYELEKPFFVLATQNPIEQEGSLSLSETVYLNGELKTGFEILKELKNINYIEDKKGIRLYNINGNTLSLETDGSIQKKKCYVYTLPYKEQFINIKTKTGKTITVTKNHPFLVNDRGLIIWKKAEELTKEDYLINPKKIKINNKMNILSHKNTLKIIGKELPKNIKIDNDFGFWIAFILSEGHIGDRHIEICQKNYPEATKKYIKISKRYGFDPKISMNKGCTYVKIYSKTLVEYLDLRFGIKNRKNKQIPKSFLNLPNKVNIEFLKTFISLESSIDNNRIVFTQKKKDDINMISYMLLRENIVSWIKDNKRVYRIKIQGEDLIKFIKKIGWISKEKLDDKNFNRKIKSSFRVIPVDRKNVLEIVESFGLNSFHTLKGRKKLTTRKWYGSYKGIKEGENVMSVESLKLFVKDIKNEIKFRKSTKFIKNKTNNPRYFASNIGLPINKISDEIKVSKNQIWKIYTGQSINETCQIQVQELLTCKYTESIQKVEQLLKYFEALLSEDIYFDKIKEIKYKNKGEMAFGLTVPDKQNYIAGFGACGINHNTYVLPEAQTDRFLLKILIDYPSSEEELEIINRYTIGDNEIKVNKIIGKSSLITLQKLTRQVPISNEIKTRVVKIINTTREMKDLLEYGASPRASIGLILAAKARAILNGRSHVSKEDINKMAFPILRHRIVLNFEAERKGLTPDDIIQKIIDKVK